MPAGRMEMKIAVTIEKAAAMSGIGRTGLCKLVRAGEIRPRKRGKRTPIIVTGWMPTSVRCSCSMCRKHRRGTAEDHVAVVNSPPDLEAGEKLYHCPPPPDGNLSHRLACRADRRGTTSSRKGCGRASERWQTRPFASFMISEQLAGLVPASPHAYCVSVAGPGACGRVAFITALRSIQPNATTVTTLATRTAPMMKRGVIRGRAATLRVARGEPARSPQEPAERR